MNDSVEIGTQAPTIILFGQPFRGVRQAAWFTEIETAAARKMATSKALAVIEPIPPELDELTKTLPKGRLDGGQATLTKVPTDVYSKLLAAAGAQQKAKSAKVITVPEQTGSLVPVDPAPQAPTTLAAWDALKPGDLVVAPYGGPEDGWWTARIIRVDSDSFVLSWCDDTEPTVRRTKAQLALVYPR